MAKPSFLHLFPDESEVEEAASSPALPSTNALPVPAQVPEKGSQEGSSTLASYQSYPSGPVSTPPTPTAEWTKVHKKTYVPQHARSLWPDEPTITQDAGNGEVNAELTERVSRHAGVNAHPRPGAGYHSQAKVEHQFHSNLVNKYLQSLLNKPVTDTWKDAPEVPTANELLDLNERWTNIKQNEDGTEQVVIEGNHLEGPWADEEQYLAAHYAMLREEAVQPLRNAISWVKAYPHAPEDTAVGGGLGIYTKVHLTTITFSGRGLGIRVVFSLSKVGKKVRWEQSKRLIAGTLVALSPTKDLFRTKCIVATVAARPLDLVQEDPPKIDLFFARPEDIDLDPTIEYTMIEDRTSFFEAVRHIGVSLQKMTTEAFPLKKHIVGVNDRVPPPKYITEQPVMDLRSVFEAKGKDENNRLREVDVIKDFPKNAQTTLDKSQQDALAHILHRRVALIQGPPGTGKTHVSVMALKLLMQNMASEDPPIVVACQTNHALDQLLRHVAKFEENFIRLGGRSKDTGIVKQRTLYNVLAKQRFKAPGGMRTSARNTLKNLEDLMNDVLAPLEYGKDQSSIGFMDLETYRKAKVLTEKQCDMLEKGDQEWAGPSSAGKSPLAQWLGNHMQHNQRTFKQDGDFMGSEFEEADLEFEQLKELEAENVCQDDENDFESLHGNGVGIFIAISGKHAEVSDAQMEKWLKSDNLWKIPSRFRGAVFNHIQRKVIVKRNEQFHGLADRYATAVMKHRYGAFENNAILLRQQKIIGVTTTGLSKYRGLIAAICPRVIMIEEAAETMEAPVAAGCVPTLEHLILVGDHKQLRPQCGVKELEREPFNMNVSMFERLVNNKLPFKMLKRQRRMIPEIRRLLGPIYKNDIKDHIDMRKPEVRPPVPGMGGINSFFYTHAWPDNVDEQMSATNAQEADMVIGFYDHLISNGLTQDQITVLCFYNGQRKLILRKLRNHPRLKRMNNGTVNIFKVLTVDSYQGEENEVVLLSLVRSNDQGKIGFLSVENRICVALSRAKRGFYMFGNVELLACESKLWAKIINIMLADASVIEEDRKPANPPHGRVVWNIPLCCTKHNRKMYIEHFEDWDKISGGCDLRCEELLPCGHKCGLNCHPFAHDKTICLQRCDKVLECGHQCVRECHDACHCPLCGTKRLAISNGNMVVSDDSSNSESMGSNARAWQEFAKGGHVPHDKAMREIQRDNYLAAQAKLTMTPETAKYGPASPPPSTPESVSFMHKAATASSSRVPSASDALVKDASGANGVTSAPKLHPLPPLIDSGAWSPVKATQVQAPAAPVAVPVVQPQPKPKVKVSHRDRFNRAAPSATPIITTTPPAAPAMTQAIQSAPPMGYTGMPDLQAPLQPRRHPVLPPPTPMTAVPFTSRQVNRNDYGVPNGGPAVDNPAGPVEAKKVNEDLLIDID